MSTTYINHAGHDETAFSDRVEIRCRFCGYATVYALPLTSYDDNPTHPCVPEGA